MALKSIYELTKTTMIDENHTILVYQDNSFKKLAAKDIFYSRDDIQDRLVSPRNEIINALTRLNIEVDPDSSLENLLKYFDEIILTE